VSAAGPRLLVASFNPGKTRELVRLLSPLGVDVVSPADLGLREPYEETGSTYEENARGKALHYAALARLPALADDSGLEVDALGGRPGPLSARYGGPDLDDAGRNLLLLEALADVPEERRTARYVAVAALARPAVPPETRLFRATCEGRIATSTRGTHGFGYDPLFFYPPHAATFGEIDSERKDRVSHRGQALAQVVAFLKSAEGSQFLTA
jgi:XTP/dITP diphosphohydrolase